MTNKGSKNGLIALIEEAIRSFKNFSAGYLSALRDFFNEPIVQGFFDQPKLFIKGSFKYVKHSLKDLNISLSETIPMFDLIKQAFLIFSLILIISCLIIVSVFFQVGNRWDNNYYIVNIPNGYVSSQVAELLDEMDIIDGKYGFALLINTFRLQNRIQSGTYKLKPDMPLITIVLKLKRGEIVPPALSKITFPEGSSIYNIGSVLAKDGVGDSQAFRKLTDITDWGDLKERYPFLNELKIDSLEGYLFPDTYFVPSDISTDQMINVMLSRFNKLIMPFWTKSKKDTAYSFHEILTLASIIEKEAAVPEERPIISSVFHNRLNKKMYLAADPTIKYALSKFRKPTKRVYYIDLEVKSPYNTYKRLGLPPGPICNPGLDSIKAAIYPAKTDFLYFVARKDGTHIFSTNWQDHERARQEVRRSSLIPTQ